jgi:hypothetical protein
MNTSFEAIFRFVLLDFIHSLRFQCCFTVVELHSQNYQVRSITFGS